MKFVSTKVDNLGLWRAVSPDIGEIEVLLIPLTKQFAKGNITLDRKIFKFFKDHLKKKINLYILEARRI